MRHIIISLIVLFASNTAFGQTATISGKIYHLETGKALTAVKVIFSNESDSLFTITDMYGKYEIRLRPGSYSVRTNYFRNDDTVLKDIQVTDGMTKDIGIIPNLLSRQERLLRSGKWHYEGDAEGATATEIIKMETVSDGTADPLSPGSMGGEASALAPASDGAGSREVMVKDARMPPPPKGEAGMLTSGEVNDFRKWDLWQDIEQTDLDGYSGQWNMHPRERYTVQLTTLDGKPAIDRTVQLIAADGRIIWHGRSDNTGKAELWANVFAGAQDAPAMIRIINGEEIREINDIKRFHDGINFSGINSYCDTPGDVDILFTVDATGSMGDEISYLKAEMLDIISKIEEKYESLNFRTGSIFYRDNGDKYIVRTSDLSEDAKTTDKFINANFAGGGGDFPEGVDMALQTAVNDITWSERAVARIMFLILDAPPHDDSVSVEKIRRISEKAAALGIRIVPVACSGVDKSTEFLMRSLSLATNGTYVFLTDHSGIGNPHIEPTTDKYDVEKLNDLFIRLIDQFTMTADCSGQAIAGEDVSDNIYNHDETHPIDEDLEALVSLVRCFPNPTDGILNIDITGALDALFLVDISGKIVQRFENPAEGRQQINLGSYPTGVYFLKFSSQNKWASSKVLLMR